jgi:hypothetical protein
MAAVWNVMQGDIKEEEQEAKWKKKIKNILCRECSFLM